MTVVVPHEKGLSATAMMEGVLVRRFRYFWPEGCEQLAYGFGVPDNLRYKFWAKVSLPFFMPAFFLSAWRASSSCDVIHAHWEFAGLIGLAIARLRRKPLILTVHRLVTRSFLTRTLTKFLLPKCDSLHFNSSYTQYLAKATVGVRVHDALIYPSVEPSFFEQKNSNTKIWDKFNLPRDRKGKMVLGLGRLVEKKGFRYLLRGFAQWVANSSQDSQGAFLVLAGGGPLLQELRDEAKALSIADRVFFTDFILPQDVRDLMQQSDIFVVPSIVDERGEVETLGVVAIEALACGLPVIATNIGGVPDVIEDGRTGMLIEPQSAEAIANALGVLLANESLRATFRNLGPERVAERFTWDRASERTIASYEAVLYKKN